MKIILVICLILTACFADNFSDNPANHPKERPAICPKTSIYQEINDHVKGEGTDADIYKAVIDVCRKRGIKDSATINNILSNYYL